MSDIEYQFGVDKAAKYTLNRIKTKLESMDPHFHTNEAKDAANKKKPNIKFLGRQAKLTLTWAEKGNIVYFHLHPCFVAERAQCLI